MKKELNSIKNNSLAIGDDYYKKYRKTKANEDADLSLKAYRTALRAMTIEVLKGITK